MTPGSSAGPTGEPLSLERVVQLLGGRELALLAAHDPRSPGGETLAIALRDELQEPPTPGRFRAARVMYWIAVDGRGRHTEIDRRSSTPHEATCVWGTIRVTDRLGMARSFLSFGGTLRARALDQRTTIVTVDSPAPIVEWIADGRSVDPFSAEVAVFFARLRVPISVTPGAEERILGTPPLRLYAAMIGDLARRMSDSAALRRAEPQIHELVKREDHRLRGSAPIEWQAGKTLDTELGLGAD